MKRLCRLLAVLLLMASLALEICPSAFAYQAEQYYVENKSLTRVTTVQVSAGRNYSGAVKRRDQMLRAGYDSFIYEKDGVYRIMCGKFYDLQEAEYYCESIKANTDRSDAYLTNAYLPDWAIQDFQDEYSGYDYYDDFFDARLSPWSFDGDQYYKHSSDRTKVYTVQVSAGYNRSGAEKRRDQMLKAGYDSFLYKKGDVYRVMCGKFHSRDDAQIYLDSILATTDREDAYITSARLPNSAIDRFEEIYYGW